MQVSIACNMGGGSRDCGGGGAIGDYALKERRAAANAANANTRTRVEPFRPLGHAHMNEAPGHHSDMMYRTLGKSGLRVSCLGLGACETFGSQISDQEAEQVLTLAYESGVNLFDTTEVYARGRAESTLGSILKKKSWSRSSYVVTIKIYWGGVAETERGLSRKHIVEGLRSALRRLQLDYVDIVFANRSDVSGPIEEVVRTMSFLIDQGLSMYWGTSRWSPVEIMEAYSVARQLNLVAPVCEQTEYHYFYRDKVELQLPQLYHQIGVGAVTWVPLITRKHLEDPSVKEPVCAEAQKQLSKIRDLQHVAQRLNCTPAQLAIAWCLRSGGVASVLMGVANTEQLRENLLSIRVHGSSPFLSDMRTPPYTPPQI
ncbi:unnamed protein product [Knipowitschia caucasica]|uniref:NADP-dependent oxidoreductase domain-containing protein n=1 Tax=Knipowitschia caucasica TaxID=637954 RepID=A0AAV2KMX0_KNICA